MAAKWGWLFGIGKRLLLCGILLVLLIGSLALLFTRRGEPQNRTVKRLQPLERKIMTSNKNSRGSNPQASTPSYTSLTRKLLTILLEISLIIAILFAVGLAVLLIFFMFIYHSSLEEAVSSTNSAMNILAAVYFVANTFLAIIAIAALFFARSQFLAAREQNRLSHNISRASTYLEIDRKYNEDAVRYSRRKIIAIKHRYEREKNAIANKSLSEYAHEIFQKEWHERYDQDSTLTGKDSEYSKSVKFLDFLEDMGVLVSREYLNKEDLFDLMGGLIILTEEVMRENMKWTRNRLQSRSIHANAINLMMAAKEYKESHKMIEYNEGEYKITSLS